jgi:hypothetical protein
MCLLLRYIILVLVAIWDVRVIKPDDAVPVYGAFETRRRLHTVVIFTVVKAISRKQNLAAACVCNVYIKIDWIDERRQDDLAVVCIH